MTWALRGSLDHPALLECERRINQLVVGGDPHDIVAVCQYDLRRFDTSRVEGTRGLHGLSVRGHTMPFEPTLRIVSRDDPPGLRLTARST